MKSLISNKVIEYKKILTTFAAMLSRLVALLLIPLLLGANMSRIMVFAGFQLNRNYISSKLCENRNKPWMHCNGKCYLAKKLKQAEEKEKQQEQETQKNLVQDSFTPESLTVFFSTRLESIVDTRYIFSTTARYTPLIFQPPKV